MIIVAVFGNYDYDTALDLSLASRAFGASSIVFTDPKIDYKKIKRYINKINKSMGGEFEVKFNANGRSLLREKRVYKTVYLTLGGKMLKDNIRVLRNYRNLILVVSSKDLNYLKELSDFTISITKQPHSSVSAVAVFLHSFYEGRELSISFKNALD